MLDAESQSQSADLIENPVVYDVHSFSIWIHPVGGYSTFDILSRF